MQTCDLIRNVYARDSLSILAHTSVRLIFCAHASTRVHARASMSIREHASTSIYARSGCSVCMSAVIYSMILHLSLMEGIDH